MRNYRSIVVALGLALSLTVASAEAAPITGAFSISGSFFPVNGVTGALSTLSAATGIDFGTALSPGTAGAFSIGLGAANGDFSFLAGTSGLIRDFAFAGAGSTNFPVTPVLSFQTFAAAPSLTFSLQSIGTTFQNSSFLLLSGVGTFSMNGFSPTPGTFDFSGNGAGGTFSFSASNAAVPQVPEPASLVLLGAGLLVCAASLSRRRRRTS